MSSSQKIILSVLLFTASLATAFSFSHDYYYGRDESLQYLKKLLSFPQKPERFSAYVKYPQPNVPSVYEFNWQSCGPATDPVSAEVTLSPDPLPIPGNITLSTNATLKVDVASPVKLALTIQKKVLVWITIPCIDDIGSCTYGDACVLLEQAFPTTCPPPFSTYGLPCKCPFQAGTYSLPPSVIEVQNVNIPSWLTSGDYKVKAVLTALDGSELACYDVDLTLN